MQAGVARQLRMEGRHHHRALPAAHRSVVDRRPAPRPRARPARPPGARMNTACSGRVEPADVEVGLEGVDLAAEGVAAHADVDGRRSCAGRAGRRARRRPAGSSRRRCRTPACPRRAAAATGSNSPLASSSFEIVGRLAARDDERVDARRGQRACAPRRVATPRSSQHLAVRLDRALQGEDADAHLGARWASRTGRTRARWLTSRARRAWCRARRSRGPAWPRPGPG